MTRASGFDTLLASMLALVFDMRFGGRHPQLGRRYRQLEGRAEGTSAAGASTGHGLAPEQAAGGRPLAAALSWLFCCK